MNHGRIDECCVAEGPVVGVTARFSPVQAGAAGAASRAQWSLDAALAALLQQCGAAVVMLPPVADGIAGAARRCVRTLDGLVLQGGGDLRLRGRESDPLSTHSGEDGDRLRDGWESVLLMQARDAGMPILGLCRGMHLLNVSRGGSLRLDFAAPAACDRTVHDDRGNYGRHRHPVRLHAGGRLQALYRCAALTVGSAHRHAVDRLGSGLRVEASAEDGVVEAVSAQDGRWELGLQWHPEFALTPLELSQSRRLLDDFVAACRSGRASSPALPAAAGASAC